MQCFQQECEKVLDLWDYYPKLKLSIGYCDSLIKVRAISGEMSWKIEYTFEKIYQPTLDQYCLKRYAKLYALYL